MAIALDDPALSSALARLASAHRRQTLVPFLGAGMSVESLVQWQAFVENLETRAGAAPGRPPSDTGLLERAHRAIRKLRRTGRATALREAIDGALRPAGRAGCEVTQQTAQLARLRWPLVLTTNYDDLFVRAVAHERPEEPVRVVGRGDEDCRRVLAALSEPGEPLLWALHGYLGKVDGRDPPALSDSELVIGHEEYRRVLHHEAHFRRAFGEVLRTRSLLFLGCGLGDPDVLAVIEETLALVGPSAHPHFAVLFSDDGEAIDKERMLELRLGVTPIVLRHYSELPEFLAALEQASKDDAARQVRWSYRLRCPPAQIDAPQPAPDVEIVRGGLPADVPEPEGLVVSAGELPGLGCNGTHALFFSSPIRKLLERCHVDVEKHTLFAAPRAVVAVPRRDDAPPRTVAAFARDPEPGTSWSASDSRDACSIFAAMTNVLHWARDQQRSVIHCQLLAAGDRSPYPPRIALAQMLRAVGAYPAGTGRRPRVVIHLVNAQLLDELSAGRVDPIELLDPGCLRIWIEVDEGGHRTERVQRFAAYDDTLGDLAKAFFVDGDGWGASVFPDPRLKVSSVMLVRERTDWTLAELGLLPGSTLRFQRIRTGNAAQHQE